MWQNKDMDMEEDKNYEEPLLVRLKNKIKVIFRKS